jgi:FkbM family methyltransferase
MLVAAARKVANRLGVELSPYPGRLSRHRLAMLLDHHKVDVVLDVGANTGQYARSLRQFGYRGQIVSFEPMEVEHAALARSAAKDHHWRTVHYALGQTQGDSVINVAGNSISSSILPMLETHATIAPHSLYTHTEKIEVNRLDDVLGELVMDSQRVFLKIDTQGFEREVLAGAAASIPKLVGLQIEMSFVPLYDGQMLLAEALKTATGYGMVMEGVESGFMHQDGRLFQMDGIFFRPFDS